MSNRNKPKEAERLTATKSRHLSRFTSRLILIPQMHIVVAIRRFHSLTLSQRGYGLNAGLGALHPHVNKKAAPLKRGSIEVPGGIICPPAVCKINAQIRTVPVPLPKVNTAVRLALTPPVAKRQTSHLRRDADAITASVWPHAQHKAPGVSSMGFRMCVAWPSSFEPANMASAYDSGAIQRIELAFVSI